MLLALQLLMDISYISFNCNQIANANDLFHITASGWIGTI